MLRTLSFFICAVSASNSRSTLSSMTSVLVVFAPVMPSLKAEVMCEFCSRTWRWVRTSFFCTTPQVTARTGITTSTHSASFQFRSSIDTAAPIRYAMSHTPSIRPQASVEAILSVSDMTRAWI